jgi:DNA invertase Pin-like site-specific DNA recombinase
MVVRKEQVTQAYLTSTSMVVDLYCRVSGKKQEDNTSLDEQEEMGRKFAEENGLTVGLVHREVGSGFTLDRKKLKEMQDRYRRGIIQGVIIWKMAGLPGNKSLLTTLW